MSALCFAHAEAARGRGWVLGNKVVRNRGTCIEAGCEGAALYVLGIKGPRPQPEPRQAVPAEPSIPAPAEPAPMEAKRTGRREQPRSIPCDRTRTCPHCVLGTITPVSAAYIPHPSGSGGSNTRNAGP